MKFRSFLIALCLLSTAPASAFNCGEGLLKQYEATFIAKAKRYFKAYQDVAFLARNYNLVRSAGDRIKWMNVVKARRRLDRNISNAPWAVKRALKVQREKLFFSFEQSLSEREQPKAEILFDSSLNAVQSSIHEAGVLLFEREDFANRIEFLFQRYLPGVSHGLRPNDRGAFRLAGVLDAYELVRAPAMKEHAVASLEFSDLNRLLLNERSRLLKESPEMLPTLLPALIEEAHLLESSLEVVAAEVEHDYLPNRHKFLIDEYLHLAEQRLLEPKTHLKHTDFAFHTEFRKEGGNLFAYLFLDTARHAFSWVNQRLIFLPEEG